MPVWRPDRKELAADILQGLLLTAAGALLFYDTLLAAIPMSPLAWLWHRERRESRRKKEQARLRKMFREWILLLAGSLSAGYSVENAFRQSYRELQLMFPSGGPMLDALKDMLARSENNQGAEVMLKEFAAAYPLPEIRSFVDVFCAAKYSGGSLNLVIRSTAAQIAQIMDTRREIETMLSSRAYEQKIMSVMPAAILLYLRVGSADFLEGLYHCLPGAAVMTVCLIIYLAAYLLGKRLVDIEI